MINVEEHEDGSFTISWDENDPQESIFNDWTKEDFINFFKYRLEYDKSVKEYLGEDTKNSGKKSGETSNITEATEEDYKDFWEGDDISEQDFDEKYDNYIQAINEDTFWEIPPLEEGFPTKDDRLWEG